MNKAVLATLCFAAGAGFGFAVGYYMVTKKDSAEDKEFVEPITVDKKSEPEPEVKTQFDITPARLAKRPGETGINYTEFVKDLQYKMETTGPSEEDSYEDGDSSIEEQMNMEDFEETYEERLEREAEEALEHSEKYKRDHKGKIELMTSDEWDTDYPESDYEREDLYYFTESDILTDEDGHQLPEAETIGTKVRQVGWMQSPDEVIYVRNHPQENEYRIFKEHCTVEDWF